MLKINYLLFFIGIYLLSSCRVKQAVLFKSEGEINKEEFEKAYSAAAKNYTIAELDYIAVSIFTNKGERLVDPNNEFVSGDNKSLIQQNGGQQQGTMMQGGQLGQPGNSQFVNTPIDRPLRGNNQIPHSYLVASDGKANLPMIGEVKLAGLSLKQADSLLAAKYAEYYAEPYVVTQYLNKRVVLMGAMGDKVIPLFNEHMTLIEVLAMSGSFQLNGRPDRIRLIRGDLKNPSVQHIDLSTIEGMKKANLQLQPHDIIYVEPRWRFDRSSFADITSFLTILTSVFTIYLLVDNLTKR
jgi:polysaccharide export outer membrane protein